MTAATTAMWVFAALLGVAGIRKVISPAATGAALQGARLPSDTRLVRLLGAGEVALAAIVLLVGGAVPAIILAAVYAGFGAFAERQRRRGAGCGCFGESDAPATILHVGVDVAAAVTALVAAVGSAPALPAALSGDVVTAAVAVVLLAVATSTLQLALTALPELAAAAALGAADRNTA